MALKRNMETFIGCDASYEDSSIVLFGAPFDSTTSFRPGARFGPAARAAGKSVGLRINRNVPPRKVMKFTTPVRRAAVWEPPAPSGTRT